MNRKQRFRDRREALMARHDRGSILLRGAAGEAPNPNFFYLTGIEEPRAALLLAAAGTRIETGPAHPGPDYVRGRMTRHVLFLPPPNPLASRWGEGSAATSDRVRADDVGTDAVLGTTELQPFLEKMLASTEVLHFVRGLPASLGDHHDADAAFLARVRERYFGLEIRDATDTVNEMRQAKDADEVRAIERSIALTGEVLDRILGSVRAGMGERELEAEITHHYTAHGATHAFDPIVACGANAVLPHYKANNGPVESGQLLLIDTGACLEGYRSDITRTYPVDGHFTDRQRTIYETVLRAQQEAIAACRPGALIAEIHATAYRVIDSAGFGKYFIHGTSHHLGLETHDVGDVHRPLPQGAVITVEPGIYIADEAIGVRIEDDILITEDGHENLSKAIPKTVEDIERGMT